MNDRQKKAIRNLLFNCASLRASDRVLILCDPLTRNIADAFYSIEAKYSYEIVILEIPLLSNHGSEPPAYAADLMQTATVIISLCTYSLAHSRARIDANGAGARFLSLPLYNWDLLDDLSLQIDFKSQANIVRVVTDVFTQGKAVHVTSLAGTDIHLDITDRIGNYCPGFVQNPGDLGSPPDIESNVSPIEDASDGIVVVDGSITHPSLGLLDSPIKLSIRHGRIVEFSGENQIHVTVLEEMFDAQDSLRRILAECGVGLNPKAKLTGNMLTDEAALGCMHFGFGSNHTVGGKNKVDFHLDFVFQRATLEVDGRILLKEGILQL